MYSDLALAVEAEVLERWRFLKQDKWQCLMFFLACSHVSRTSPSILHTLNACEYCSIDECGYILYLSQCSLVWEEQLVLLVFVSHFKITDFARQALFILKDTHLQTCPPLPPFLSPRSVLRLSSLPQLSANAKVSVMLKTHES